MAWVYATYFVKCVECNGANNSAEPFCSDVCEANARNRNER